MRDAHNRILALILCVLALQALWLDTPARAEEPLKIAALVTPGDLTEPGEATLIVMLSNVGRAQATNIRIAPDENQSGVSIEPINAGASYVFEVKFNVSKKQLDAGRVDVIVNYRSSGTNYKNKLYAAVTSVNAQAQVNISRHMPNCARAGDIAQIVYLAENTGSVAINELYITDTPIGYISAQISLAAGESKKFTNYVTVSGTLVSSPIARFVSAETGMSYRYIVPERTLALATDNVSMTWHEDADAPTLTVVNNGGFTYSEMRLQASALGGALNIPEVLKPNASFTYTWRAAGAGEYTATLKARDDAGNEVSFTSPKYVCESAPVNVSDAKLSLTVATPSARISNAGEVEFIIDIYGGAHNTRGARLSEPTLGDVRTFAVLPAGERTTLTVSANVTADHTYVFALAYEDDAGNTQTVSAAPISIQIAAGGAEAKAPRAQENMHGVRGVSNLPTIIICACAALVILMVILMLIRRREKNKKRKRKRVKRDLGDTGEYTPIRMRRKRDAK